MSRYHFYHRGVGGCVISWFQEVGNAVITLEGYFNVRIFVKVSDFSDLW